MLHLWMDMDVCRECDMFASGATGAAVVVVVARAMRRQQVAVSFASHCNESPDLMVTYGINNNLWRQHERTRHLLAVIYSLNPGD